MPDRSQKQNSLSSQVGVRVHSIRSINVERDGYKQDIAERYVLTAQSRTLLKRILGQSDLTAPSRAWTLTGPYGSGKSYFGLYLTSLADARQPGHESAQRKLLETDRLLGEEIVASVQLRQSSGLLSIPITGYRAPLLEIIQKSLSTGLRQLPAEVVQPLLVELDTWSKETSSRTVIAWLENLLGVITTSHHYHGLLIVLDELGKILEYAADHPDRADVYILQELAEFANRSAERPFLVVSILHQAFERYAVHLDGVTQREWAKVQGRYEDVAFQEPPHQQMWLLAKAIDHQDLPALKPHLAYARHQAQAAADTWCPPMMRHEDYINLCQQAYPFHPTAFTSLPYIFRRLGQNERSTFAYLTSHEPFGFQEFLQRHAAPDCIRMADLFDYLAANFQPQIYTSRTTRALTEALERLHSAADLTNVEAEAVKAIGLLNWLSSVSHLQATEPTLRAALQTDGRSEEEITTALETLRHRSLVVYRRFDQTYRIWQGSDIDIEERMDTAQRQMTSAFSLAGAVQEYLPSQPLVARRHSHITGTLRFFNVQYLDWSNHEHWEMQQQTEASGTVFLCLPANPSESDAFCQWAQQPPLSEQADRLIVVAGHTYRLGELVHELRCLHWVRENTPALRDDPVARRELRERVTTVESLIRSELNRVLSLHRLSAASGCRWYYQGQAITDRAARGLTSFLSVICDRLYPDAPRIWNELLNRRNLSSQGSAARRNLIEAMLTQTENPGLGIEGYPPERSMYESLLKAGGIHRSGEANRWTMAEPPLEDPLGLRPCWQAIADYVFALPPEPRSVEALFQQLGAPPFGVNNGVLPVLLCAFMLAHQHETTLYREGSLLAEPGVADWEVLLRRPDLFAVAGCRVTGPQAKVVERFARGLQTEPAALPVVRNLIRQVKSLPDYAWRTQQLPDEALAVRRAIDQARSPERLLLHDLPQAVNATPFTDNGATVSEIETFFQRLNTALQALATSTPQRIAWARDRLLEVCGLDSGEAGWQVFRNEAAAMLPHAHDNDLLPLLRAALPSTASWAKTTLLQRRVPGR